MRNVLFVLLLCPTLVFSIEKCDSSVPLGVLSACYEREFKSSDAALNKAYSKLKNAVSESLYEQSSKDTYWSELVQSQRSWLKMRDKQCQAKVAFFEAQSFAGLIEKNKCLSLTTNSRVIYLEGENKFISELP
ncbi:lysozyme inhibitor LprI family protein [Aeromonas encheleia]|uniref:lysozyme inhibitor LprI family protein n=1 Tax=Aeromonas encheleia TaxID=73010 RepID=UPI0014768A8B|nr:lysozyme inhibitor LprI family protein [Aeromonas encheleia]